MQIPSLQIPSLNMKLPLKLGRKAGPDVVGLDIQPGFVAAVRARVNGSIVPEQAAALALPGDAVRDGEVMDETVLSAFASASPTSARCCARSSCLR